MSKGDVLMAERRDLTVKSDFLELLRDQFSDCVEILDETPDQNTGEVKFHIKVTDKEKWLSKTSLLMPFLGELYFDAYEDKESGRDYAGNKEETLQGILDQDSDHAFTDDMYVVAAGSKVKGFLSMKNYPPVQDLTVSYLLLVVVNQDNRGGQVGKELYRKMFAHNDADMIVGISHTPAAVKIRCKLGDEFGYDTYFCGHKNGVMDDGPATGIEQEKLVVAGNIAYEYGGEMAQVADLPPPGYITYKRGETMAPLSVDELQFKPGDSLAETFKDLLNKQENSQDVVYGVLASIKR